MITICKGCHDNEQLRGRPTLPSKHLVGDEGGAHGVAPHSPIKDISLGMRGAPTEWRPYKPTPNWISYQGRFPQVGEGGSLSERSTGCSFNIRIAS